jgi:VWFA-related protein
MFPVVLLAQSPDAPLVLRSETRAVQISVVARNKAGEPIRDLHSQDFTIFDDGQPRRVQFFSREGDFATSARPAEPRVTAIVLDALNSEFSDQSFARDQAIKAVERMRIDESVAVLTLTPALRMQDFTRDRQPLLAAIEGFQPILPPYGMKQRIQVTLAALKTLADHMSKAAGRKSIVWITGGFPAIKAYEGAVETTPHRINEADVAIYPVDTRGLTVGRASNLQIMDQFAESTGGRPYYNGNDVAGSIEDALADSRSAYVIGFYLGDRERDRRFHALKVEVDRPDALLRYRRGYSPSSTTRN